MAKLAIIGAGFTGASLGLALRSCKLFDHIAGYDPDRARLETARRVGALDEDSRTAAAAVNQAAVVVVTAPASELEAIWRGLGLALSPGAVVSDTTLWRAQAERSAAALPEGVHFVGGRPVLHGAGHGPEQASADAFRSAVYCLTPAPTASEAAVNALSAVVTAAGAQPYFLEAAEHDALTAAGELLPGALLACLARTLTADSAWKDAGKLAGDSLNRAATLAEDMPPDFWQHAAENGPALARWLETTASALLDMRDRLAAGRPAMSAGEWQTTLQALARWRAERRQLRDGDMPSKAALKPNLLGTLGRRR